MRALMLAFACRQQYHALRAAAAAGYEVHVLGRDGARGLEYSRCCASFHALDFDPAGRPLEEGLAEITRVAKKLSADVILPSDIVSTRLLCALATRLPARTCALPGPACFDMMNDKWRFHRFCVEHGIRVPQTWLFDDVTQVSAAARDGTLPFPFIVKPHDAMGGQGIHKVMDEAGLNSLDAAGYKPLLVQKLILGDEIDISILAHKGRIGAYAIQRNLPRKYAFVRHDQLLAQAARAVEASGFHGVAHFDAIEEKVTGDIYLIECNPRLWMSIFAATVAGLNFVELSLETEKLDPGNPRCIADTDVSNERSTRQLIMELVRKRRVSMVDLRLLGYELSDPWGKRHAMDPQFDDAPRAPGTPGSIDHQIAALAAISAAGH